MSNLFQLLYENKTLKTKVYLGHRHYWDHTLRKGKYKVSYEEYGRQFYPDFCSGGGFVLSPDVVKNVIPYFRKKPFKLDDVYIAMLVLNAGVYPTHNYNFKFWETDCLYKKGYIAQHAKGITAKRSCIMLLFQNMLADVSGDDFIRTHYGNQL